MSFDPFDIHSVPLDGTNLIEAGAGTGKTYTIAGLYLRLIVEKSFTVDQILVVTFTKAATEELKQRVRARLMEARQAFVSGKSDDDLLNHLLQRANDPQMSLVRLSDAIRDFDSCAIFTIHGFCQRILHENAFETGTLFDTELVTEQRDLLIPICEDYWRKRLYEAPPEFIRYALIKLKGPDAFYKLLLKYKSPDLLVIPQQARPALPSLEAFRDACQAVVNAWPEARGAVETLLMDAALNGTAYGSFKAHKHQPDSTIREVKIKALMAAMDGFCAHAALRFPLFKEFDRFCASFITQKTKKGNSTPLHAFFNQCETLGNLEQSLLPEMQSLLLFIQADLFRFAHQKLPVLKKARNVQYFDDLLTLVRDALSKPGAHLLASAVKHRFRAALVDEFQDTDMLQYTIFSRLFSGRGSLFFMIGDPKQAIYGFRGADIFSYMHASSRAEKRYTLLTNYRSHPKLITAVNTLFSRVKKPFVFAEIPFADGRAAENNPNNRKNADGRLEIWFAGSNDGKPLNKGDAEQIISHAVAKDIQCLIAGPDGTDPGDIAVLVRTNLQAELVKQDLARHQVPAVIYSDGNVFETRESRDLYLLLVSISDPFHPGRFRAALATSIMGVPIESLDLESDQEGWQADFVKRFAEYHQIWMVHGFMRMLNRLMTREKVRPRLLAMEEGERRLTNLLHLAELIHDSAVRSSLAMPALLKWFSMQRDPQSGIPETHQLRLESDALTVKIITIHKSKGLEFPVVFCPFVWGASTIQGAGFTFHDMAGEQRLTLDLGSQNMEGNRVQAQLEQLAENLRLLYVALTRARERCVLAWGRINKVETSALAYLLHYAPENGADPSSGDLLGEVQFQYRSKSEKALVRDLKALEGASDHSIQVSVLPAGVPSAAHHDPGGRFKVTGADLENLSLRRMEAPVERDWRIFSYSSLTSAKIPFSPQGAGISVPGQPLIDAPAYDDPQVDELPDRDETALVDPGTASPRDKDDEIAGEHTIFTFAKGAHAGIFFHDLFEHLDFTALGKADLETTVAEKIKAYGIDSVWHGTMLKMIDNVLNLPLESEQDAFTLSMISSRQRINEMEFYFPLKKISAATLQTAFKARESGNRLMGFPEHMGRLQFAPAKGFMKGFIDMVFGFNDRYYIVDWKSNHLGYTVEDYHFSALDAAMPTSYYTLQYHIYTLALHLFLQLRLPGYQYEKDFGGVFYLYIRGMDREKGPGWGVFYDRPQKSLIDSLENAMLPAVDAPSLRI